MERIRKGSDLPKKKRGSPSIQQKYWHTKLTPRSSALCFVEFSTQCARLKMTWHVRAYILVPRGRAPFGQHQIATSGLLQRHSGFEWLCKHNRLRAEPIKFVRLDSGHAQNDGKSVNCGLLVLDLARGRDSWC